MEPCVDLVRSHLTFELVVILNYLSEGSVLIKYCTHLKFFSVINLIFMQNNNESPPYSKIGPVNEI